MYMIAYTVSDISVLRQYDEVNEELINNVLDLSSSRGFTCVKVMVFDGNKIVYDYERGKSAPVSRRNRIVFDYIRDATNHDVYLLRKAYAKSLFNMDIGEYLK